MERTTIFARRFLVWVVLFPVCGGGSPGAAGSFQAAPHRSEAGAGTIEPARPDPERLAREASWWHRFSTTEPALAETQATLARAHRLWRRSGRAAGCADARRRLSRIDRHALYDGAAYEVVVELEQALDALGGAARACIDRRYFEFGYRLDLARGSLARLEEQRRRLLDR